MTRFTLSKHEGFCQLLTDVLHASMEIVFYKLHLMIINLLPLLSFVLVCQAKAFIMWKVIVHSDFKLEELFAFACMSFVWC